MGANVSTMRPARDLLHQLPMLPTRPDLSVDYEAADAAQLLALAIAVQLLLQHSNVDMRLGPLRWVFAWAPLHRFHHMKYGRAGDVNFGLFFNLWDWLLGTAFYRSDYRMGPGDLGIGSRPDFPQAYGAQLRDPFMPVRSAKEPPLPEALRK